MKRFTLIFLFIGMAWTNSLLKAQPEGLSLGVRLTNWWGLTAKYNFSEVGAIEGIANTRWGGYIIHGLYEHHFPAFKIQGMRWYVGGGAHIGFWSDRYNNGNYWFADSRSGGVGIGLDLIGGLEYTIPDLPLNISLDIKPGFNFVPSALPFYDDGAISVRYVF